MLIPVSKVQEIVTAWLDEVIMPKSSGMQKFGITLFLLQKGPEMADKVKLFADSNGFIESDNLSASLIKAGGKLIIPGINWEFDEDDLAKLIEKAKAYV